jgi:hypothetical protein
VFLATGGLTLKIALFYKKGTFGRKGECTPCTPLDLPMIERVCNPLLLYLVLVSNLLSDWFKSSDQNYEIPVHGIGVVTMFSN